MLLLEYMAGKIKLTDANIKGIKYLYTMEGVSTRQIADTYGVSHVQVWRIVKGLQRKNKSL